MSQELPPPPPDDQHGLMIPIQQLQGLARMWVQWRPIIGWGAKIARQKIPRELDEMLGAVAGGDPNAVANLQSMAAGQEPGQMEVPENKIGDRVLANDEGRLAWYLVRVQGNTYRDARDIMAEKYGVNVSHSTIKNYVDEIDATDAEDRQLRRMGVYKTLFFFTVTALVGFLAGHFLRF